MRLTFPIFLQIEGLLFKTLTGLISSTASCKLPLQNMKIVMSSGWLEEVLAHFWPWSSHVCLVTKILQGWSLQVGEGSDGKRNNFEDCDTLVKSFCVN